MTPARVLVTGGAGFVGHHLVSYLLHQTDWNLVLLDRLDHSGNLNRLAEVLEEFKPHIAPRVKFFFHDLRAEFGSQVTAQLGAFDYIFHLAAATHVDRAIADPLPFVMDNVVGTCNLLTYARQVGCDKFFYFSTDEVFGPAAKVLELDKERGLPTFEAYREWDRYRSGNPYAATKAGAEELCLAFHNTYGVPVVITHCMNVFGERQHPEKFIPHIIAAVSRGETLPIYATPDLRKSGSRFYIHAASVAEAVRFLVDRGEPGDKYNIVGDREVDNLALAQLVAGMVGKELKYAMVDFHSSRPGHDLRYALDGSKMKALGWRPTRNFESRLLQVVRWTLANPRWLVA